jgi:magnesium transporter
MKVNLYVKKGEKIHVYDQLNLSDIEGKVLWIDLEEPDENIKDQLELKYDIDFRSDKEIVEIEASSRYIEDEDTIIANTNFATLTSDDNFDADMVSMILNKDGILFTLRKRSYRPFYNTARKVLSLPRLFNNGFQILVTLFETRVDYEADMVEFITKKIDKLSREIVTDEINNEILMDIKELQEKQMLLRESIIDKQRLVSAFLKSELLPKENVEKLRILIKDISSLIDYSKFNFERLEYLQDTFLGLVNMEQNKIIKIFTVVSVIFLPPTLIASIYGMNFKVMPELNWVFGYPVSLLLMVASSIGTLWFFKKKNWL